MNDKARECAADEILALYRGHDATKEEILSVLSQHFPPAVPVEKLKEALRTADLRTTSWVPDIRHRRAELLVADVKALITEQEMPK
jgi:hypothetical protein